MKAVLEERPGRLPLATACRALGLNRGTLYARQKLVRRDTPLVPHTARPQPRALTDTERQTVLAIMNSDAYCDQPPAQVYQTLLEQGRYLCSVRTMHRILQTSQAHGERRHQRPPQNHAMPRLVARAPNEVWTWDITKLTTQRRGEYLNLYVVIDLFSRYIVAWMISLKENSALAKQLMNESIARYGLQRLTIHQDRGAPMIAQCYLDLMGELGATCSHSRPRVSNDNAFSESQFKTMKYQPDFPRRFESLGQARCWMVDYVRWYNGLHHHSGLAGYTPEQVFTGKHKELATIKQQALDAQYRKHPERFVGGRPKVSTPPTVVAINPVQPSDADVASTTQVNFPTLPYAQEVQRKNTLTLS
ncbi:MAG: IS3 family transposase [Alcanivoracaceae bacterium]